MLVKEFYERIGGDYESVKDRLCSDALILRFLGKFPDDSSYLQLMEAVEREDIPAATVATHTLKGIVANLSFTKLFDATVELLAWLRRENQTTIDMQLVARVQESYQETVSLIAQL